jgi:hypothetical protein
LLRKAEGGVGDVAVGLSFPDDAGLEQVGLEVAAVAINRLEVPQRSRPEVMPPGDQRLQRELPGQEAGEVLVALDGLPGGQEPVVDVHVAAFPQGVAAGVP